MFVITFVSESIDERSIVAMMEDLWTLPFLVALFALPNNPNPWIFFVSNMFAYSASYSGLLKFSGRGNWSVVISVSIDLLESIS